MNRNIFAPVLALPPDAVNHEGAPAYWLSDKEALAQLAVTGCFNQTFYASANDQLDELMRVARRLIGGGEALYVAKVARYARKHGHMKDSPAFLAAMLLAADSAPAIRTVAWEAIDNVKLLRNMVQVVRSGVLGRKSFGTRLKREINNWLAGHDLEFLFKGASGTQPSLADIIRMTHPRPSESLARNALYGYLVGAELRKSKKAQLPHCVKQYEGFRKYVLGGAKNTCVFDLPDVSPERFTDLPLLPRHWRQLALNSGWHWLRMNLNTLSRRGCFGPGLENERFVSDVALRLRSPEAIRAARIFPYQILTTFTNLGPDIPQEIAEALHEAMEIAAENVPAIPGDLVVCLDVSGSMRAPITGTRKGATSKTVCIQVAALIATVLCRANPKTWLLPFASEAMQLKHFTLRDSILTNATKLASLPSGGTDCSAPLKVVNHYEKKPDLVVFVSDNESWMDAAEFQTGMMREWAILKKRAPGAKLACIDLTPNAAKQAPTSRDVLNVGGFSDSVFEVLNDFVHERRSWTQRIEDANA